MQKSTDSGCCQVYQDPNSGQLRSFCFGSMCGTFHSHSHGDEDDSDYSETDDEDEDDYEDDDEEDEEEVKNTAPTFQNPEVSNQQTVSRKPGQCSNE